MINLILCEVVVNGQTNNLGFFLYNVRAQKKCYKKDPHLYLENQEKRYTEKCDWLLGKQATCTIENSTSM